MDNREYEFTYESCAIENNSYTLQETIDAIAEGKRVPDKSDREFQEIVNHHKAFDYICDLSRKSLKDLKLDDILAIHKILLKDINNEEAGKLRKVNVRVGDPELRFPNWTLVPRIMNRFMQWLNLGKITAPLAPENMFLTEIDPLTFAAEAHSNFVLIHPFIDGNGRMARLIMNLVLLNKGKYFAIIRKKDREHYFASIKTTLENRGCADPFKALMESGME
jgi:Fic family protein